MATEKSKFTDVSCSIASLPEEILINHIFVRLTPRTISRCKCVCKGWNGLLTGSYFKLTQLNHQKLHTPFNILCGPTYYRDGLPGVSKEEYSRKYEAFYGCFYSLHLHFRMKVVVFSLPGFRNVLGNYEIQEMVGYCKGNVCLQLYDKDVKSMKKHLLFGNPYSGAYKVISSPADSPLLTGFVYDSSLDDYICVIVHRDTKDVHLYSLKLKSWRIKSGAFQHERIECRVGVALGWSLYWLDDGRDRIIKYNVKYDQFTEMHLPFGIQLPSEMQKIEFCLKAVGSSICITSCGRKSGQVKMWSFSIQNAKWTLFMSVNFKKEYGVFRIFPLTPTKDGKILCDMIVNQETKFVLIDPKTGRLENLTVIDENGGDWLAPAQLLFEHRQMVYPGYN